MPDVRGRPNLPPPRSRAEVGWSEAHVQWHALSEASSKRWSRTLCGSRIPDTAGWSWFEADRFPDGPPVPGIRPICPKCLERVGRLPEGDRQ